MLYLVTVLVSGIMVGGIYALVSVGLNLIFGVVRIVNFAQGELVMLGMYGAFYLHLWLGLNPYAAILVVAPIMFLFGVFIQRTLIQPLQDKPMMQTFATFGLSMLLANLVLAGTRGEALTLRLGASSGSLSVAGIDLPYDRLGTLVSALIATVGLHLFLTRTMAGKAIRAVTQDRMAARVIGVNVERTYLVTFGLGTALAGVAGVLLAPIYTLAPSIGENFMLAAFAVVILGGLGSIWGSLVGGMLVGVMEILSGFYVDPALKSAIWFSIFFAVLLVRPAGLFGRVGAEEIGFRAH